MPRPDALGLPVWRPSIRLLHWALALSVVTAWLTDHGPSGLHEGAGYCVLAIVAARVAIGVFGPKADRFAAFVAGARATLGYARAVLAGTEPRYLGHNPLGGWMIAALLALSLVTGATGWLFTTDRFWGVAWVEEVHGFSADLLIALAAIHVLGVVFTSVRQGENLAAAMITGRKPRTTPRRPEPPVDLADAG